MQKVIGVPSDSLMRINDRLRLSCIDYSERYKNPSILRNTSRDNGNTYQRIFQTQDAIKTSSTYRNKKKNISENIGSILKYENGPKFREDVIYLRYY